LPFRNETVNDFHNTLLDRMPGSQPTFEALNHVAVENLQEAAEPFAAEYLQSNDLPSIPPSSWKLKMEAPVILIRNLSPTQRIV